MGKANEFGQDQIFETESYLSSIIQNTDTYEYVYFLI